VHGYIPVIVKDAIASEEVDLEEFVATIEATIPRHLLGDLEMIYIGDFPSLEGRNAIYQEGAIYITNQEATTHDMLENVIHEIAHAAEEAHGSVIYGDDRLKVEFLAKRERLHQILTAHGYHIDPQLYGMTEYNREFDDFLSDKVGYPLLVSLTMGLFSSPYGATSLREYFANGFEKYYLGEGRRVKETSPALYSILNDLHRESDS